MAAVSGTRNKANPSTDQLDHVTSAQEERAFVEMMNLLTGTVGFTLHVDLLSGMDSLWVLPSLKVGLSFSSTCGGGSIRHIPSP